MGIRVQPKMKNMTEAEKKAWEEKLTYLSNNNLQRDAINKINDARGWIF
tara:strand:- start:384 stop:530 length:147 start_codon:yes stop_codon:yes gene_type:complete